MPDALALLKACGAAAVIAAVATIIGALPWVKSRLRIATITQVIGLALGMAVGLWLLDVRVHWPPREDQDRLLLILMPAIFAIEMIVARLQLRRWLAWPLRLIIAAAAAPVLLYGSTYFTAGDSMVQPEWSPGTTNLVLAILATSLIVPWFLLVLQTRQSDPSTPADSRDWPGITIVLALAVVVGGSGITIMLSGYATGGELGLPIAAALVGVAAITATRKGYGGLPGVVSVGTLALFSLLLIGRFFGQLTTAHALALWLTPLLCWVLDLPYIRGLRRPLLIPARVLVTIPPVIIVLLLAQRAFIQDSARTKSDVNSPTPEPTLDDYMNFGK